MHLGGFYRHYIKTFLGMKDDTSMDKLIETNNKLVCEVIILEQRMAAKDQQLINIYQAHYELRMRHEQLKIATGKKDEEIDKLEHQIQAMKDQEMDNQESSVNLIEF